MDKIIDNLYLGDIRAAANLFLLKSHVSGSVSRKYILRNLSGTAKIRKGKSLKNNFQLAYKWSFRVFFGFEYLDLLEKCLLNFT